MMRVIWILAVILSVGAIGCSLLDPPDPEAGSGTVILRFENGPDEASVNGVSSPGLSEALAAADSVTVCVYRPGPDGTLEVCKGAGLTSQQGTITVALTVIAEKNKRVAVEIFEAGKLLYFGVDEAVDVIAGRNTDVSIVAQAFGVGNLWTVPVAITEGTDFEFRWNSVPGATTYRFQESLFPSFSVINWEFSTSDTAIQVPAGTLAKGNYFYRVAAENAYTASEFSGVRHVDVYGPPVITDFGPAEMYRGGEVTIVGDDLNHPSTQVTLYDLGCTVISATRTALQVTVPPGAFTDVFRMSNDAGSAQSSRSLGVQNIAYIMGDESMGVVDTLGAFYYKEEIDTYGDVILNSRVGIIPVQYIPALDMSVFDIIIVGWDTGTDENDWGGSVKEISDAIRFSGAQVLGMGLGGAAYFAVINLDIGIQAAQVGFHRDVFVVDPSLAIYKAPNLVPIPGDRILDIYKQQEMALSIDVDIASLPPGVSVYAARPPLSTLFPMIDQKEVNGLQSTTNFLWGFHAFPGPNLAAMTNEGRAVFGNVVKMLFDAANPSVVDPTN